MLTKYKSKETLLLKYFGSSPTLRIVNFFLDNHLSDYSKNEIAKNLAISRATFYKYWKILEKSGAIQETRQIGRATMYARQEERIVRQLIKFDMALARKSMDRAIEAEH